MSCGASPVSSRSLATFAGCSMTSRSVSRSSGANTWASIGTPASAGNSRRSSRNSERIAAITRTGPAMTSPNSWANRWRASGVVRVNSSSAWSIDTSSRRWCVPGPAASRSSATRRRPSAPASSRPRISLANEPNSRRWAVVASARASSGSGSVPGTSDGIVNHAGSLASSGTTPALSSEDFPQPDGPTMASSPPVPPITRTRLPTSRASTARPKNTRLRAAVNGSNPGKGFSPSRQALPLSSSSRTAWSTRSRARPGSAR